MITNTLNTLKTGLAAAIVLASTAVALPASAAELNLGLDSANATGFTIDQVHDNDSIYKQLNTADDHQHFGDTANDKAGIFSQSSSNGFRASVRLSNPSLYWE